MKKLILFLSLLLSISIFPTSYVHADSALETINIDGEIYTIETTINDNYLNTLLPDLYSSNKSVTKTGTLQVKNSSGNTVWSLKLTATFSYNGSTAKCISCNEKATSFSSNWKTKSSSSSKNNNKATASGVVVHTKGNAQQSFTKSITLQCSKTGIVS